jgi:DNA-binding HxlR family transcriptional regulator
MSMATRSKAELRDEAREAYNAFLAMCPTRALLDTLADKWLCLVIAALRDGPQRYSDLARVIAGVSQKMLTQTLRTCERDGLITRTVTASVPVRVDYELTELGVTLLPVMGAIKGWAEAHMDEVRNARKSYGG